jgi:hypothetical protein
VRTTSAVAGVLPTGKRRASGSRHGPTTDVGSTNSSRKGPTVIRNQYPVRRRYPMRSRFAIVTAIVLALCLGASSAMAQPMDQMPSAVPPAKANVYVPPAQLYSEPTAPTSQQPLPASATANSDGDNSPWLVVGLAAGGVVVLCGCVVGFQRTRRKHPVA